MKVSDKDPGEAHTLAVTNAASAYGTWSVNADGQWTYKLSNGNAAVQALGAGDKMTDSFVVTSQDGSGTKTVTITITGTNDVATLSGQASGSVTEGATSPISGTLNVSDKDTGQAGTKSASGTSTYGVWSVDTAGHWSYQLDNASAAVKALTAGQTATDSFTVKSTDGSASKLVTVTIHGTDDTTTITGDNVGSVKEDGTLTDTGTLTVSGAMSGTQAASGNSSYGAWSVDAAGHWTYTLSNGNTAVQALGAGAHLSDSFTVTSEDGTASKVVNVTINGTNDVPTMAGQTNGTVTENAGIDAAGTVTVSDKDSDQAHTKAQSANAKYGHWSIDTAGHWTYHLDDTNTVVDKLGAGQTLTDSFAVTSEDGTTHKAVTVTIHGTNDAPVAEDGSISGDVNGTITGHVVATDPEGSAITYSSDGGFHGSVAMKADGSFTYAPEFNFTGSDIFAYQADDGHGGTATATVSVTITPAHPEVQIDLGELDGSNGFLVYGNAEASSAGRFLSNAGDINGDGFDDVIVGTYYARGDVIPHGAVIVFGTAHGFPTAIDSGDLDGSDGFQIVGTSPEGDGGSLIATGDFNGDGIDDIVLGSWGGYANGDRPGVTYLVYGKASGWDATFDISTLDGTNGFRLAGVKDYDHAGESVSLGDVNGDGFADLIVGATRTHSDPAANGTAYILFGHDGGSAADVSLSAATGTAGFTIAGPGNSYGRDYFGYSTTTADINGDGFADVVVGAYGAAAVVFGHSGSISAIDAASLDGADGFLVTGAYHSSVGIDVASLGDINGDGYGDLVFSYGLPTSSTSCAVLFGHSGLFASTIDLGSLDGHNGFTLTGGGLSPFNAIASAGDVNGDGYADIIVGDGSADSGGGGDSGTSYVLFGSAHGFGSSVNLSDLSLEQGFSLNGAHPSDFAGWTVAGAGDVNGDGYDDIIVGALGLDSGGSTAGGGGYVVFGGDFNGAVTHQGSGGADTIQGTTGADDIVAGNGDDTVHGAGGADVVKAGAGDDHIHVSDNLFRLVDGGANTDTLHLDFAGAIDFGNIDGNAATSDRGKIAGIETIDVTNGQNNALTLHLADVLDMDVRNTNVGGVASLDNVLKIDGDAGDALHLATADGWSAANTATLAGYAVYTHDAVKIAVDSDIHVTVG